MKASRTRVPFLLLATWLTFRSISDLPRGLYGSGVDVPALGMALSYIGLVPWLILATPVVFTIGRFKECVQADTIVRAHLYFVAVQVVGLAHSSMEFGLDGFMAGSYLIAVCISFIYVYILGLRVGEFADLLNAKAAWNRSAKLLAWTLVPSLSIALIQLATGTGRDVDGIRRVYGGTSSPNVLGGLLLVSLGVSAFCRAPSRVLARLVIGVAVCLFIACFSMSGFVSMAFSVALYVVIRARATGRIRIKISWLIGALIFVYLVAILAGAVISSRLHELQDSDNSLVWRIRTWATYYQLLLQPRVALVGAGLGIDHLGMPEEPHNEWLRVLAETGFLGVIFFAMTWIRMIKALRQVGALPSVKLQQRATALLSAVGGLMLWGVVDSVLRTAPSALVVWTAAGLLIGFSRSYARCEAEAGFTCDAPSLPHRSDGVVSVPVV